MALDDDRYTDSGTGTSGWGMTEMMFPDTYFRNADDQFFSLWMTERSPEVLLPFLATWVDDNRPWARDQLMQYVLRVPESSAHRLVLKRLFKRCEYGRDHQILGCFLVTLDRMLRRQLTGCRLPDGDDRLRLPSRRRVQQRLRRGKTECSGDSPVLSIGDTKDPSADGPLYSNRTALYLRRRVWRYFRRLSFDDPSAYLHTITESLKRYEDRDFHDGENLLDNWSLMHACYFHSGLLEFSAVHVNLNQGSTLNDLRAAPWKSALWMTPEALPLLIDLIESAGSALVRIWAMELFTQRTADCESTGAGLLARFLSNADRRVRRFAMFLLRNNRVLNTFGSVEWILLLNASERRCQPVICDVMMKSLMPAKFTTGQLVELTRNPGDEISRIGFSMLSERQKAQPMTVEELVSLSRVCCESQSGMVTQWTLIRLESHLSDMDDQSAADHLINFFESSLMSVRTSAMDRLDDPTCVAHRNTKLWCRLLATPHDDLRIRLVSFLHRQTENRSLSVNRRNRHQSAGSGDQLYSRFQSEAGESLIRFWCTVLVDAKFGVRVHRQALSEVCEYLGRHPDAADLVMPAIASMVRSSRIEERRAGLAAVAGLNAGTSQFTPAMTRCIPDIVWEV